MLLSIRRRRNNIYYNPQKERLRKTLFLLYRLIDFRVLYCIIFWFIYRLCAMNKYTVPAFEVSIYPFASATKDTQSLFHHAIEARKKWDQPVSKFHVWAAIQVSGCEEKIYLWANCENVNFNGSTHAEQCAINGALMKKSNDKYGSMIIESIAVVGAMDDVHFGDITTMTQDRLSTILQWKTLEEIMDSFCTPCGHCRQIIAPYSNVQTQVHLLNPQWMIAQLPFKNLLPFPFLQIK